VGCSSIIVRSHKYDGRLHREWRAELISADGPLLTVSGAFEAEVRHPLLGTIPAGTLSKEYFWTDRWYSIFRFSKPQGELQCIYCNVNTPVRFAEGVLDFVDLDIDVLVAPDFSFRVLDQEEFDANERILGYPPDFRTKAYEALSEIRGLIEARRFPFREQDVRGL
jgi:protein associated with RNAse G/E